MFTLSDMQRFATEAWGELGSAIVQQWRHFNARYFAGALRPVPVVITHAQPFGKRLAFCSYAGADRAGRTITLNVPKDHGSLLADNNTLLHEMIHQLLFERGEPASHDSAGWRREIMRLNKLITGEEIWAGRSMTKRVAGADGKLSKVVRLNAPHDDGRASLGQAEIARWPHEGSGIDLGHLGQVIPSSRLPGGRQRASLVARARARPRVV
jgi:hypothetical protein